jgi:SAM-dependent methyltransferase
MKSQAELEHEAVWRRYDDVEVRLTAELSERMLDLAGLGPGSRVLDLATGRGEPAIRAARRVGTEGRVLGVDLHDGLLELARERATREGITNLELRAGDVAELDDLPEAGFDAVTCRWGLMYVGAPIDALVCARRALVRGGALVAAMWCEPERVAYHGLPRRLLEPFRAPPPIDPDAPGVFRFADLERTRRDFASAGLAIDLVEELEVDVFEADDADEMIAWVRAMALARSLDGLSATDQRAWHDAMVGALEANRRDGRLRLGGTTRLVRARPA